MSADRYRELLACPRLVEREVPAHLAVRTVADNCATHQYAKIKAWLPGWMRARAITRTSC